MARTALVTGGNRGLGLETCRQLATAGCSVLLTARRAGAGEQAAAELRQEGLDVRFLELDVASDQSIQQLADRLQRENIRLDILINNAGVFLDAAPDQAQSSILAVTRDLLRASMETNVYGPIRLVQALRPVLNQGGRIVNISSGMGQLSEMNGCCPGYRISKTALNAVTRILAQELEAADIRVNSVCPGWVRTDMGGSDAPLTPAQGASTAVWLATTEDCSSGGFYRDKKPIAW